MKTPKKKKNSAVPKDYTEDEVIQILNRIANKLASRFKFGYHDIEDMKQQAILEGWKGLSKYNPEYGGLESFLWVHIRNRLFNFKRDNYHRSDKPCDKCPIKQWNKIEKECNLYTMDSLEDCRFYYDWILRNESRKNLVDTIEIDDIEDENEKRMHIHTDFAQTYDVKMIEKILEAELPMKYWADYDRFKCGAKLAKPKREAIRTLILEILAKHGIENYE
jgi:DNA-directed RNA polymerase specialized sigma24 family protein